MKYLRMLVVLLVWLVGCASPAAGIPTPTVSPERSTTSPVGPTVASGRATPVVGGRATPVVGGQSRRTAPTAVTPLVFPVISPSPTPLLLGIGAPEPAATNLVIAPVNTDQGLADGLLQAVNVLRASGSCVALTSEPRLVTAASKHAADLATTRRIDHVGSDGAVLLERLTRVGYAAAWAGENIAAGFQTAQEVMDAWTLGDEDPAGPHRQNILNCTYSQAGVGLIRAADGYPYWVLDLATP